MSLDPEREEVLLAVSAKHDLDPANTSLVKACRELEQLGYLRLAELYQSLDSERHLYQMTVLHLTPEGERELRAIKARRRI